MSLPHNIVLISDASLKTNHHTILAVKDMHTEINLCRDLLQSYVPVELIWNVNMLGQAVDVSIITEGHNEISSCIKDVVANYPYLKPREMMTFVYEF